MTTDDHTTRTLLLPQKANGFLVVSRGSTSNLDLEAASLGSGHSQIKAFDLHNPRGSTYDFDSDGVRLGWGLRNSVGVAEHPLTGGIYSVENSADNIQRDGQDIHQDNPGEELNFHGYLNGTEYAFQGQNYGYPFCFAAWQVADIPENGNISVGSQFAIDPTEGQSRNDSYCVAQVPPRLTFQAHMAPLDIKFNDSGASAWVTYHGSWDRTDPVGYKLSVIAFANGEPVAASDNKTAVVDVFSNSDNSLCPDHCFRPVGIAFDKSGRLFMSSDGTGEIYVVVREEEHTVGTPTFTSSASGSTSGSKPTQSGAASPYSRSRAYRKVSVCISLLVCLFV